MNYDELSFVNQQLAGMLKSGVPLEGALRELSATMQRGVLRDELTALEADLAKGTPLADALARRKLPEFYVRMVQVGAKSGDLPGVLLLLADYYARANALWTRLKGLMVYPLIVLIVSTGVVVLMASVLTALAREAHVNVLDISGSAVALPHPTLLLVLLWIPAILLAALAGVWIAFTFSPRLRANLGFRLPGFREASLAHFAATMGLLIRSGTTLPESLAFAASLERGSRLGREAIRWRQELVAGAAKSSNPPKSLVMPPLFSWLVASAGENLALGFTRAAELYHARALYRMEMLLYAALPVSILILGVTVIVQLWPVWRSLKAIWDVMFSIGDF